MKVGSKRVSHDMPFGARLLGHGEGAVFRLWAPGDAHIELILHRVHGQVAFACRADAAGWREVRVPYAREGERYQWRVHGQTEPLLVPDPASRSNPQGVHQPSVLIDPNAFEWDEDWCGRPWSQAVSYELHVGTFTPQGTFDAARERLPQLAELGITCIQLMPLSSFPGRFGWGYDGVLHFAPYAAYGPPEALKAFIQAAHRLGLMVMLDVVYNHFGPDGNYLPLYAPNFFTERHPTPWGAGINFDGANAVPVREFFIHNALYWLCEYQFDGLRFDAVHAMQDDARPDIMDEISRRVRSHCTGRHVHLVLENDFNDARRLAPAAVPGRFDAQWSGDFHHTLHVLLTGEREGYYAEYAEKPQQMLARALTNGFAMEGAPHLSDDAAQRHHPRRPSTRPVSLGCILNFLQNHDQIGNRAFGERLTQLLPEAPLRLAVAMLLLNPASPMIFMGDEHGARTPFLYFADWQGELHQAVVEGRRKEFAKFKAFADAASRQRIPDPCDVGTFERSKLDWSEFDTPSAKRWKAFYTAIIALRRDLLQPMLPALAQGHTAILNGHVLTVRWQFMPPGQQGRCLEMQVNLDEASQATPAWSQAGQNLFELGESTPDGLGPWSGRWHWLVPTDPQ